MNSVVLFLAALVLISVLFAGSFLFARRIDNYGVVDVVWSYAFGLLALLYAFFSEGWEPRRWLFGALAIAWSMRLGTHLAVRVARHHPEEDTRYKAMRKRWKHAFEFEMFKFFQLQALSVPVLGLPFLLAMANGASGLHPLEVAGAIIWAIGIGGESLADAQLAAFKREGGNRGRVCDVGLWKYSRHPNYFFEWLIWVGFAVFALASPWGWLGFIAPASILYLLLRVTGIPMAEEQSLQSKGDAYRRYQARTSPFVPWFPRRAAG